MRRSVLEKNVQSLFVFVFIFFQNLSDGGVRDEEGRSVFEMFNRCFSNKCFRDTIRFFVFVGLFFVFVCLSFCICGR